MAVVNRPYFETVPPELQRQYDEIDRLMVGMLQELADKLRQFSQKPIRTTKATHADFDRSRYASLQRTALALASDLERAISNGGFRK
jgi:phosphate uptake regulator